MNSINIIFAFVGTLLKLEGWNNGTMANAMAEIHSDQWKQKVYI